MTATRSTIAPLALGLLWVLLPAPPCPAAPVSLSAPHTVLGWAGREGELVYNTTLRDADFGDSVRVPLRLTFRSNDNSVSPAGWNGWFCGALQARVVPEGNERWAVQLLCNKTLYFVPDPDATPPQGAQAFASASGEWAAVLTPADGKFTMTRWDGWELEFRNGRIHHCTTDSGKRINWHHDGAGRLTSVSTPDAGAVITVTWNGGAVSQLTVNGSDYAIQSNAGELTGITYPDGTTRAFSYTTNPHPGGRVEAPGDDPLNASGLGDGTRTLTATDRHGVARDFTWYVPTGFLYSDSEYLYWFSRSYTDKDVRPDMTLAWYETLPTAAPFATGGTPASLPATQGGDPPQTATLATTGGNSLRTYTAFNGLVRKSYLFKAAGKLHGKVQRVEETWDGKTVETYRAAYDADSGRLLRSFDAHGNTTEYSYVDRDDISPHAPEQKVTVTDPLGHSTTIERDIHGNVVKVTDPTGATFELDYDARNRLTAVRDTAGDTVGSFAYNERDDVVTASDGAGAAWTHSWQDFHGRSLLLQSQSPTGLAFTNSYDAAGQLVSSTGPDGNGASYAWNARHLVESVTDALGHATTFAYDADANPVTTTYADATASTATYDRRGIATGTTDPNGHTTAYQTDPGGWLAQLSDPRGKQTSWTQYKDGGPAVKTYPGGAKDEYSYDDRGLPTSLKLRDGAARVDLAHDQAGRLVQRSWSHGAMAGFASYDRDDAGRLVASQAGSTSWPAGLALQQSHSYDANGRLATTSQNGRSLSLARDAAGRVATLTYPGGMVVGYQFDADGRVTAIKKDGATLASYTYDNAGRRATRTLANGATTTYSRDAAGQLLDIHVTDGSGTTLARHSYAYDNVGERTTRTEVLPGFGTSQEAFGYDAAGQLVSAAYQQPHPGAGAGGGSLSAATTAYDAAGNRSLATRDAVPLAYAANDLNQYSQVGGLPQSHNSRGDLASHRGWALAYDAVGHLVQATGPGSSPTVIHYLHDGGGRRVGRSQSGAGGWDTTWFLQLGVEVMEARNPATGATAHFIHEPGLDQPLCRVDATVGASGSVVHYFHQDALGSVVALTNPAGAVVESYRYTAWGRPNVYDSNGILQAAGTPAQSAYLFTGREYEVATGLAHHRARSYSPELGRWTGPDPIGEAGGVNLYGYVYNSPVNYWDPLGLEILLETHPVALGNNHSKITIIPDNQAAYANDPRFSNTLPDGRKYATLGAGPEDGNLVSNPNRPRDINLDHNNSSTSLNPADCGDGSRSEDQIIEDLFKSDGAYDDKFDYELFPNRFSNGYNSNGYVSGLLNAVGFSPSAPPGTPGFTKPVPKKSFGKP